MSFQVRSYPFTLGAGGSQNLAVIGDWLKLYSATGTLRVRMPTLGVTVDLLPGQGISGVPFDQLIIEDSSGAANSGRLIVAYSGADQLAVERQAAFIEDRIFGTVDVVDGGKARTLANAAFAGAYGITANAGEYPHLQIFNPVASLKRVILKGVMLSSGIVNVQAGIFEYSSAMPTLVGNVASKLIGGAASSAEARSQSNASLLGIGPGFWSGQVLANSSLATTFQEPIVLAPGKGIVARVGTLASTLIASWDFIEETI